MTLDQLIQDIPKLLAYFLCIICLVQLFFIFFIQREDIMKGLKGKDKMWQFLELSGIVWLVLFPIVVVCSLLGIAVESYLWTTLDAVYFMNLGGKMGNKWLDNNKYGTTTTTKEELKVDITSTDNTDSQ